MGFLFHNVLVLGRGVADLDKQTTAAQIALAEVRVPTAVPDYGTRTPNILSRRILLRRISGLPAKRVYNRFAMRSRMAHTLALAFATALLMLAAGLFPSHILFAQSQQTQTQQPEAALPSFDVVSIKPDNSGWGGMNSTPGLVPHISIINIRLDNLIESAYGVRDFQVFGAPGWIKTKRYDIKATIDESLLQQLRNLPADEQVHQRQMMMQSLLADRFKLRVTHATKQFPAFNLVLLKDTAKLKPFAVDPFPRTPKGLVFISLRGARGDQVELIKANVSQLTVGLTTAVDEPVMDHTGVTGNYSLKLRWTDASQLPATATTPDPDFDRTLAEALRELGLKLEPTTAARDTITIDHIEKPTPN